MVKLVRLLPNESFLDLSIQFGEDCFFLALEDLCRSPRIECFGRNFSTREGSLSDGLGLVVLVDKQEMGQSLTINKQHDADFAIANSSYVQKALSHE